MCIKTFRLLIVGPNVLNYLNYILCIKYIFVSTHMFLGRHSFFRLLVMR